MSAVRRVPATDDTPGSSTGTAGSPNRAAAQSAEPGAADVGVGGVSAVLREYASAVRGAWSEVDGRTVQGVLCELADALDGTAPAHIRERTLEQWRDELGICPAGQGHRTAHCQPFTTLYPGTPNEYIDGCGNNPTSW